MADTTQHIEPIAGDQPASLEVGIKHRQFDYPKLKNSQCLWNWIGIVLLCIASSALTAWTLLYFGWVKVDVSKTIADNRQSIVSQQGEAISSIFSQVNPSTVAITTQAVTTNGFFGPVAQEGAGSGIIISSDGYIITNKHVVPDGTSQVTVILSDGRQFTNVTVVARDPSNDLAFLKIPNASGLTPATIGDSSTVTPGQGVVAIGNALGQFRNSVTSGIISGIGRPIQAADSTGSSEQLEDLLQTDAAINPGNSGGPLVDLSGRVIGINTAVAQDSQGIGFAIPINDAKGMIESVTKQGKLVKPYLGVRYITLTQDSATQLNITTTNGAYLEGDSSDPAVVAGGPADKAGLKQGDIITQVNGKSLSATYGLATALAEFSPGDKVTLTILRSNKAQTVTAILGSYPGL